MQRRVLIYGMHGYRNLGAESRLVAIAEAVRRMAPDVEVVANSLHKTALDYLRGLATVRTYHPALYRPNARRLIDESDVVILSEGAMIGDRFSPALVDALTEALEHAQRRGIPTVGLALDSNYISPERRERTVRALNGITLLTVRAPGADRGLAEYGVEVAMPVTADCAVSMPLPDEGVRRAVRERYGYGDGPVHGIAPVDFYMWPALRRFVGRPKDYVRWPYKGTWPDGGRAKSEQLVRDWVGHARYLLDREAGARVAIVIMDRGDVRIARRIHAALGDPRAFVVNGQTATPYEISAALGQMTSLTSSRYHALVLASACAVPSIALGHDNRTQFFLQDMGLDRFRVAHDEPDIVARLRALHEQVLAERDDVSAQLARGFEEMRRRDAINYELLGDVLADAGCRVDRRRAAAPEEPAAVTR